MVVSGCKSRPQAVVILNFAGQVEPLRVLLHSVECCCGEFPVPSTLSALPAQVPFEIGFYYGDRSNQYGSAHPAIAVLNYVFDVAFAIDLLYRWR